MSMTVSTPYGTASTTHWPDLSENQSIPVSLGKQRFTRSVPPRTNTKKSPRHQRFTITDCLCLLLITISTLVVLGRQLSIGGPRYGDDSVHAMDGVLIHDWLMTGPSAWMHPISFAEQQYAHYPTLGIGTHYPPGFATVEAFFFAMFGISAVSARLSILFFASVATTAAYFFTRKLAGRLAGTSAAIALLTMPATVEWGRQAMLEVPTMAVLGISAVMFVRYLRRPTLTLFALLILGALSTIAFKQTSVFLIVATAATFVIIRLFNRTGVTPTQFDENPNDSALRNGPSPSTIHTIVACLIAALTIFGVWLSLDRHAAQLLRGDATYSNLWSFPVITGYLQILPEQLGWPILLSAAVGFFIAFIRHRNVAIYLIAWFLTCYVLLAIADFKYNRYIYPALFPFAIWAALGISTVLRLPLLRRFPSVITALVCVTACGIAWTQPAPIRPDYGSIITAHRAQFFGQAIFFHGLRDGDFVFAARQHLPWRSGVIIRGSKLLYTCNGRPDLDFVPRVNSRDELADVMDQFTFRYVVAEREDRLGIPQSQWLQDYLTYSGSYQLIASHRMQADAIPRKCDVTVDVYESTRSPDSTPSSLDIPIPRTNRTIRVDLPAQNANCSF